jgi:hypothetical protein
MWSELPPSLALYFSVFRIAWVVAGLLGIAVLWRRPRPGAAFAVVVLLNLATWLAYVAPLGRLYSLEEHLDRAFNVGMAACAAAGASPLEHLQVRHGSLEPFWNELVALLALFDPDRVRGVYQCLAPLSILAVAAGLFYALRQRKDEAEAWELALVVFTATLLTSYTFLWSPIPPLWSGNFLLKPNHTMGWALIAVATGLYARRAPAWKIGLVLGLLAWVFLLSWVYVGFAFFLLTLGRARDKAAWRDLVVAGAISTVLALPYIAHLWKDHSPLAHGETHQQMWRDHLGLALTEPFRVTFDLGIVFAAAVVGVVVLRRRGTTMDQALLGLLASAGVLWVAFWVGARTFGFAPEPDEHHYFLRLTMGLVAGAAFAEGARRLAARTALPLGRAHLAVMAVLLPFAFPAHWDPPSMDRYYRWSYPPIRARILKYAEWVRENTPRRAVFLAGRSASIWIPVLAGRQVLLTADSRPPVDYDARKKVEHVLLTWDDEAAVRGAARQYGITHVAVDESWMTHYGEDRIAALAKRPFYEVVYSSPVVKILKLR